MPKRQIAWSDITTFQNMFLAYKKAKRGKADRYSVTWFECQLEKSLFYLLHHLGDALPIRT